MLEGLPNHWARSSGPHTTTSHLLLASITLLSSNLRLTPDIKHVLSYVLCLAQPSQLVPAVICPTASTPAAAVAAALPRPSSGTPGVPPPQQSTSPTYVIC